MALLVYFNLPCLLQGNSQLFVHIQFSLYSLKNHLFPCLDKDTGISLSLLKSPLPKCRMSMCLSSFPFLVSKTKRSSGQAITGFFLILCVCECQSLSRLLLCDSADCSPPGSSVHGIFQARVLEWVAISFSRGIFPTQGSNPGLTHCRQTLYPLSHQGSPQESLAGQ